MKTRPTFTKSDLFQLKAAIIVLYMVQRAFLNDLEAQYGSFADNSVWKQARPIVDHTTKQLKKLYARARKMGIPAKTIYKLDITAHAIAFNWYS